MRKLIITSDGHAAEVIILDTTAAHIDDKPIPRTTCCTSISVPIMSRLWSAGTVCVGTGSVHPCMRHCFPSTTSSSTPCITRNIVPSSPLPDLICKPTPRLVVIQLEMEAIAPLSSYVCRAIPKYVVIPATKTPPEAHRIFRVTMRIFRMIWVLDSFFFKSLSYE